MMKLIHNFSLVSLGAACLDSSVNDKSVAVPCRHSRDVKFADDAALNGTEPGAELTVDP